MTDTGAIHLIAPAGDVIFVVGREEPFTKLRVSSAFLSATSGTFAALLGPKFREGQADRSSYSPIEISLPDDDGIPMSDMFHLLHFKLAPGFDVGVSSDRIYNLAVVVDKYLCAEALRLQTSSLILINRQAMASTRGADTEKLVDLFAAAYLLDDIKSFQSLGYSLILHYTQPFSELRKTSESARRLPLLLILHLEESRSNIRELCFSRIANLAKPYCRAMACAQTPKTNRAWMDDVRKKLPPQHGVWPLHFQRDGIMIADVVQSIECMGEVQMSANSTCGHSAFPSYVTQNSGAMD